MYGLVVLAHVIGAALFIAAHAVSWVAAFQLRGQRDRARQAAMLQRSGTAVGIMYIGLLVMLVAGIAAAFMGDHWGRGWLWASIAILVGVTAVMYAMATPFYGRMRAAAGLPGHAEKAASFKPPATDADLAALATDPRPMILAAVGGLGLVLITWLMLAKPF